MAGRWLRKTEYKTAFLPQLLASTYDLGTFQKNACMFALDLSTTSTEF